jgi:hypothetical protein
MDAWMQITISMMVIGLATWVGYRRDRQIRRINEAQEEWHALHKFLAAEAKWTAGMISRTPTAERAIMLRGKWSEFRGMAHLADERYRLYVGSLDKASCDTVALVVLKELARITWAHDVRISASRMRGRRRSTAE